MSQPAQSTPDFTEITADIVSSYVTNNAVHSADLPALIASVHAALQGLTAPKRAEPEKPQPPISIRKSVTPDFIISLEDGKQYKSLKRHLTKLGLTPEAYREKWGLPRDYPMVAANYAQQRSELAKSMGLGQKRREPTATRAAVQESVSVPVEAATPKRRRPAKKKASE